MAKVYVSEYNSVGGIMGAAVAAPAEPALAEQNIAIGAGSVQSNAFNTDTRLIRVHTDAICAIKIGASPTAVATDKRMPANATEYFTVTAGHKIAVITAT